LKSSKSNFSGEGVASIAINTIYLLGAQWFNRVVRLVYAIVLARYLGPELYGIICYGISWYLIFLSLTALGTGAILMREIGRDRESGSWISSLTLTIRGSGTVFAALLCGILGWYFEGKPEARNLILVFSVALIGRSLYIWTENVFTAYEVNRYSFLLQTVFRSFEVITGTVFLLFGGGAMGVVMVHAISWCLQALGGLLIMQRNLLKIWINWSWPGLKNILYNGLPIGLALIMMMWLQNGPLVLFRHLSDNENSLGQLALAMQVLTILSHIPIAVAMASLPTLSRSVDRKDGKDLLYSTTMIKSAFVFGAFAGLAGLGIGPWLVKILFGTRYEEAGRLLGLVIWLLIPLTCGNVINGIFVAMGQFFLPPICAGLGALFMSCIFKWLISTMNTSGAIIATGIGMGVWASSLIWILARSVNLDIRHTVFRPLIVIIFCLGVFFVLKPVSGLIAMLSSWTALLCGSLMFGVLTEDEWFLIASLKKKWLSKVTEQQESS